MYKHKEYIIALGILLLIIFIYVFFSFNTSGKIILNLEPSFEEGQILEGNLKILLKEG